MSKPKKRVRIAVFGSFYRGFYVLSELLKGALADHVEVVGVATDDVGAPFISRDRRVWQYPHRPEEEVMVEELARLHGLPVYKGRVKTDDFYATYENDWRPDICISATFGQLISDRLFQFPSLGFFNLHPCVDDGWPSRYAGPNPFQALLDDGHDHAVIALHAVDGGFDTGRLIGLSDKVYFPPKPTVVDLHKATAPTAAKFFVQELGRLLHQAEVAAAELNVAA